MRYRLLGRTGIEVSALSLGTMMFGAAGNRDRADCVKAIHGALDAGINLIDTADMYSNGESEEIVGIAIASRRDRVVLATKGHFPMGEGPNRSGNSRLWLTRAVEDSLRRLKTDWIDVYQVHRPDPRTDIEETLAVLSDLVRAGKIRAFGSSYTPPEDMVDAWHVAERRGYARFRTEQPSYSILTRGIEAAVLPTCHRLGLGVLTSSPLAWGFLTGKYRKGGVANLSEGRAALLPARFDPALPVNQRKLDAVEELVVLAADLGCTLPQLAIAFAAANPIVSSVIIGPRTTAQLEELVRTNVVLSDEALDRIDAIVPPGVNLYNPDLASPASLSNLGLRRRARPERAIN